MINSTTDKERLLTRIKLCCGGLDNERLRRVAKVAYEEMQNQKRAWAMQAQARADADDDDPEARSA